jgi:hypothetical protein
VALHSVGTGRAGTGSNRLHSGKLYPDVNSIVTISALQIVNLIFFGSVVLAGWLMDLCTLISISMGCLAVAFIELLLLENDRSVVNILFL